MRYTQKKESKKQQSPWQIRAVSALCNIQLLMRGGYKISLLQTKKFKMLSNR